jgi:hypothetical protein
MGHKTQPLNRFVERFLISNEATAESPVDFAFKKDCGRFARSWLEAPKI